MISKELYKHYLRIVGILLMIFILLSLIVDYDQWGSETLSVWGIVIIFAAAVMKSVLNSENDIFIAGLPISRSKLYNTILLAGITLIIGLYIICFVSIGTLGQFAFHADDYIIISISKVLMAVLVFLITSWVFLHGIPSGKMIASFFVSIMVISLYFAGTLECTLLAWGYNGRNPLYFVLGKLRFVTMERERYIHFTDIEENVANDIFSASVVERCKVFAVFTVIMLLLIIMFYRRCIVLYQRWDYASPDKNNMTKYNILVRHVIAYTALILLSVYYMVTYNVARESIFYTEENARGEQIECNGEISKFVIVESNYDGFKVQRWECERNHQILFIWFKGVMIGVGIGMIIRLIFGIQFKKIISRLLRRLRSKGGRTT